MTRILGIDPGSVAMGFGIVEYSSGRLHYVSSGCLRLPPGDLPRRLHTIYEEVGQVIRRHAPDSAAVEQVFVDRNIASAIKLGHARGAAICAIASAGLPVGEYTPAMIKQSVVGHGRADKQQVQHMVKLLLGLQGRLQADAADALAVAICHANMSATQARSGLPLRSRRR